MAIQQDGPSAVQTKSGDTLFWTEGRGKPDDQGIRILKNTQGSYMSDPPSILNFVWCYFNKLFTKKRISSSSLDGQLSRENQEGKSNNFGDRPAHAISMKELEECIKDLDNGISSAADGIPNEFIKNSKVKMRTAILDLFNSILVSGHVIEVWNIGIMFLLHKKDDRTLLNKYRVCTGHSQLG